MQLERWQNLVGEIKDKFDIQEEGREHLDEEGGVDIDYLVFKGPLGLIRLEYVTKPVILDKKTKFSNRLAAETKIEYIYSPEEKTQKLDIYKWDDSIEEWSLIDNNNIFF